MAVLVATSEAWTQSTPAGCAYQLRSACPDACKTAAEGQCFEIKSLKELQQQNAHLECKAQCVMPGMLVPPALRIMRDSACNVWIRLNSWGRMSCGISGCKSWKHNALPSRSCEALHQCHTGCLLFMIGGPVRSGTENMRAGGKIQAAVGSKSPDRG